MMLATAALACDGDDGSDAGEQPLPECVSFDVDGCAPLFSPTFDEIHTRLLVPQCTGGGSACHFDGESLGAAEHGLALLDADGAHALLLEDRGDATFVTAGDASCSPLFVRLVVEGDRRSMPPGAPLAEGERCTIAQWIEQGALR